MPDRRFYPELDTLTAAAIAGLVRGELVSGSGEAIATDIATPGDASAGAVCFISQADAAAALTDGDGVICLVLPALANALPDGAVVITTPDPKGALGLVMRAMLPDQPVATGIHPSAMIDASAVLGEGVALGPGAVVEAGVEIGAGSQIGPGAVIGQGCILGDAVVIGANSVIRYARIGEATRISPGVSVGNQGFGVARDGANYALPHIGTVVIGARCHIGANSIVDRGFLEDTVIGDAVMVDGAVHIGHNARVGDGCVICAQSGIAGSARIGSNNIFGAQSGVSDNTTIGDGNMFAARSGVTKDVGSGTVMGGFPAVPMTEFRRQQAAIRRLLKTGSKSSAPKKGDSHG